MLPDLPFLIAILLGMVAPGLGPTAPTTALLGTGASFVVAWALVRLLGDRAEAVAQQGEPLAALALRPWLTFPPLAAFAASVVLLGWRECVGSALPQAASLVAWLLVFLPVVIGFGVSWAVRARVDAAIAGSQGRAAPQAGAGEAVKAGLRRNGLALIPMFVLLGLESLLSLGAALGVPGVARLTHLVEDLPQADAALVLAVLGVLAYALPGLLTRLLPTEPLPGGPLRDALERLAAALHLDYRQMLIWNTGGRGLNAMVVGLTGRTRRIFVTDGLLRALPREEVEAVFCHEAAHARRHHLAWFLALTAMLTLANMLLNEPLDRLGMDPLSRSMLYLGLLWFGVLGWVSRRFEREADVDGGDHAALLEPDLPPHAIPSLPAPLPEGALRMVKALKRLESIVGPVPSHRHGTLADRAAYVAVHSTHPEVRAAFARAMRRMRWAFAALFVLLLGWALLRLPEDLALARSLETYREAGAAYQRAFEAAERDPARAAQEWRAAQAGFRRTAQDLEGRSQWRAATPRAEAWRLSGDSALRGTKDLALAREGFERALEALDHEGVDAAVARHTEFSARVDLTLTALRQGRPLEELRALEARADRATTTDEGPEGVYNRARLLLMAAAIEATLGERVKGRARLEELARRPGDSDGWVELRRDAKDELLRGAPDGR